MNIGNSPVAESYLCTGLSMPNLGFKFLFPLQCSALDPNVIDRGWLMHVVSLSGNGWLSVAHLQG